MRYSVTLATLLWLVSTTKGQQNDTLPKRTADPLTFVIHFDSDMADIRPIDKKSLDSMVMHHPVTSVAGIRIAGHADNSGEDDYNGRLSRRRAQAIHDYLLSKGWPDSLFRKIDGYSSHQPLNDNSTPDQRSLNRRVEVILTPRNTPPPSQNPAPALQEIFEDSTHLVGKNIILRNVNFYPARHLPLPQSNSVLQQLLVIMRKHPTLRIEIQGYICCDSGGFDGLDTDTHTRDLSVQRAKFVYDFLVSNGVDMKRVSYKGFGSNNKIYPEEKDDAQAAANRRVELKIIGF